MMIYLQQKNRIDLVMKIINSHDPVPYLDLLFCAKCGLLLEIFSEQTLAGNRECSTS